MRHAILSFLALAGTLCGQGLQNRDFEQGAPGARLEGWTVTAGSGSWKTQGCAAGQGCVDLTPPGPGSQNPNGILLQWVDATPYRGKLIRYRGAVRVTPGGRAAMWLRVDRAGQVTGLFDNMSNRPILKSEWDHYQIEGFVHQDAEKIYLGLLAFSGTVAFDDASLEITGEPPPIRDEPARPLSETGLANLTAFTRLFGVVRHFHPSDESGRTDWNRFAVEAVRRIEGAGTSADLAPMLEQAFRPAAPSLRVYTGADPALPLEGGPQVVRFHNKGFDNGKNNYKRTRAIAAGTSRSDRDLYRMDLGRGVKAIVPLAVFTDDQGRTLPPAEPSALVGVSRPAYAYSGDDRATRLGGIVLAWNVFRHFYPYFDIAGTDWDAMLPQLLRQAAVDRDRNDFHLTLQTMMAALKDGHGNVYYYGGGRRGRVPVAADWIDGKYIVTNPRDGLRRGDEILAINGKPALELLTELEKRISSATPQWSRSQSVSQALTGPLYDTCTLKVRSFGESETREVKLSYAAYSAPLAIDSRPVEISVELAPGIWYFDLTRGQDKDFQSALPKLAAAKGIVFDMRGYPRVTPMWSQHVSRTPLRSAQWHFPLVDRPGEMTFERSGEWNLTPKEPYLEAKKIFLTNGGAISYAESTMGIIEHYKLGEILGSTTAGTNGNVNPFELPGSYTLVWTGLKVLKHDGSQHHGVGIAPTIPVSRTQEGVAAGRDEILERALSLLKQ